MSERSDHFSEVFLWETPVFVRIGSGMTETIDGPIEGLDYLQKRWPAERGQKFELAVLSCRLAIQQYGSLDEARRAFIDASVEVGVLV